MGPLKGSGLPVSTPRLESKMIPTWTLWGLVDIIYVLRPFDFLLHGLGRNEPYRRTVMYEHTSTNPSSGFRVFIGPATTSPILSPVGSFFKKAI